MDKQFINLVHEIEFEKVNFRNFDRDFIDKMAAELGNRKFTYRIVEEEEANVV